MGGRKPTVSDLEILQFIYEFDEPFVFTADVKQALGFETNAGMFKRLDKLERDGYLNVKSGGNANVWWLTEAGKQAVERGEVD